MNIAEIWCHLPANQVADAAPHGYGQESRLGRWQVVQLCHCHCQALAFIWPEVILRWPPKNQNVIAKPCFSSIVSPRDVRFWPSTRHSNATIDIQAHHYFKRILNRLRRRMRSGPIINANHQFFDGRKLNKNQVMPVFEVNYSLIKLDITTLIQNT